MSVSYLSQTFRNSPYVPPIDLDLMAKVLGQEQAGFDTNYLKIQSQINDLNSLDVIKEEDRSYLQNKVNNVVNNINNLGGVDLGDENVLNGIQSHSAELYNDPTVINAVSSTKRIRSLQSSYDKMKSDPKLMKYYSEANESNDMDAVKSYLADPTVGASYNGPSAGTPYADYAKYYNDVFTKIVPQQYVKLATGNGYIEKQTGKVLSEKQVHDIAVGYLTPQQRGQMMRDGKYLYKNAGLGGDYLIPKALQSDDEQLSQEQSVADKLQQSYSAETSPAEKLKLKKQLDDQNKYVSDLKANRTKNESYYQTLYKNNPDELYYKVYADDFFKGVAKRYAINQVDATVTADPLEIAKLHENRADLRASLQSKTAIKVAEIRADATAANKNKTPGLVPDTTTSADTSDKSIPDKFDAATLDLKQTKSDMDNFLTSAAQDLMAKDPSLSLDNAKGSIQEMLGSYKASSQGKSSVIKNFPSNIDKLYEQWQMLNLKKDNLTTSVNYYNSTGKDRFTVPLYVYKNFGNEADLDKTTKFAVDKVKNDIAIKNEAGISPSAIEVLSLNRKRDGTPGYEIAYQIKGKGGSVTKGFFAVNNQTAQSLGITPETDLNNNINTYVDSYNTFKSIVRNNNDPNLNVRIMVKKMPDGTSGVFAQYVPPLNESGISESEIGENDGWTLVSKEATPAIAYATGKQLVQNFSPVKDPNDPYATQKAFMQHLNDIGSTSPIQLPNLTKELDQNDMNSKFDKIDWKFINNLPINQRPDMLLRVYGITPAEFQNHFGQYFKKP